MALSCVIDARPYMLECFDPCLEDGLVEDGGGYILEREQTAHAADLLDQLCFRGLWISMLGDGMRSGHAAPIMTTPSSGL